jgi:lysophospholipase L1-like esterase
MESAHQEAKKPRRWLLLRRLIALGAILCLAAVSYLHYFLLRPEGDGPAGPSVRAEPFAEPWTDRKVLLLGIGDSITAGFGVARQHAYFRRLAENPEDEFPEMRGLTLSAVLPNLRTKNIAESGSTSLRHVRILEAMERQPADVFGLVVMTTGGNDLIHNYGRTPPQEGAMYGATLEQASPWIANFRARLDHMIDLIEERFPGGCLIFLADIYDPSDGVGDAASARLPDWSDGVKILAEYNAILSECGAHRPSVRVVPLHDTFLGHGTHCAQFWRTHYCADDPTYWYGVNLEDPNVRGYDAVRRVFLQTIAESADAIGGKPADSGKPAK